MDVVTLGAAKADARKRYPSKARALARFTPRYPDLSPETVTVGTPISMGALGIMSVTGSTLTGAVMHPLYQSGIFTNGLNASRFRVGKWSLRARNTNYGLAASFGGTFNGGGYGTTLDFVHTGAALELRYIAEAGTATFHVDIDDQPTSAVAYSVTNGAGGSYLLPLGFSAGVKSRRIRIRSNRSMSMGGVVIAGVGALVAGGAPSGLVGLAFGDSYLDGANGVTTEDTWIQRMERYLGGEIWVDAMGGTGIVATGGGGAKAKYLDRITAAAGEARLSPDYVLLAGSTNDSNGQEVNLPTQAPLAFAAVRAAWPNAKIVVPGLTYPKGTLGTGMATANTNLKNAAIAAGVELFIDAQAEGWYTGTGNTASPNGNGNADLFASSDNLHPSPADHDFKARMIAARITDYFAKAA